jgi:Flp pilus assembly pilin Flp
MLQANYSDKGQGLVEYGLIIALVALIVIAGLALFGESVISYYFSKIVDEYIKYTSMYL